MNPRDDGVIQVKQARTTMPLGSRSCGESSKRWLMNPANSILSGAPRAVVGTAADLIYKVGCSVLGPDRLPTAKDNAWAAVCADRERARERAEVERILGARL